MRVDQEIVVPLPAATTWKLLLDTPRLVAALPGVTLLDTGGPELRGRLALNAGRVHASYAGSARVRERDDIARSVVVELRGDDANSGGRANATVRLRLRELSASTTRLDVTTEVTMLGRGGWLGEMVLADTARRLLRQLAARLPSRDRPVAASRVVDGETVDGETVDGAVDAGAEAVGPAADAAPDGSGAGSPPSMPSIGLRRTEVHVGPRRPSGATLAAAGVTLAGAVATVGLALRARRRRR